MRLQNHVLARATVGTSLLWLLLAATSCVHARIEHFQADPHRIAPGEATTVSWQVVGEATLSAEPALPDLGAIGAAGSRVCHPGASTVFTLRVTRSGNMAFARQEVQVVPPGQERVLTFRTANDGNGGLVAAETLAETDWGTLRVGAVTNASDRSIQVLHADRRVTLEPAARSLLLADTPAAGLWELRAQLLPSEVLGDPQHAPPDRLCLRIDVDPAR